MSSFFKELVAVSGLSFMILGRYLFYCLFPVFVKAAAMYLFDIKGLWRTALSSLLTQFMVIGAGGLAARLIHPELDIFYALEDTGIEKVGVAVLITLLVVYFAVDALMIRMANKTFSAGVKTYGVIIGADIVNIFLIALMFSHQIVITV
ncbi:MAG: hypothetical protein IJM75_07205 [Ruminococcus sp.]|nr:hypothetical protein [Ruminococcus sp.]